MQKVSKATILVKYRLENYLTTSCLVYNGETFNRIELIKFIANKLGGTHYELDKTKMARMRYLDEAKDTYMVADKSSVYFEFLSIGQTLSRSKYTKQLKKRIKNILVYS